MIDLCDQPFGLFIVALQARFGAVEDILADRFDKEVAPFLVARVQSVVDRKDRLSFFARDNAIAQP